jgi:ABC-type oligopeptide transport system substrate-binding subunit
MGIDYGYGEDLYPFWHSSQVKHPGNNFVGIQNKDLDIKLEEARLTQDMNLRQQKIKEAKDIINSELAEIPLKAEMMIYQSSQKIKNNDLKFLSNPLDRYNYISDWRIE